MDYVQMELLRQQRVLAALLTGGELPEYGGNGQAWERAAGMEDIGGQVLTSEARVWNRPGEEISLSLQKNVSDDMGGIAAERQAAGNTGAAAGTVLRTEDQRQLEREAFSGVHGTFEAVRRKQPRSTDTVDVWPFRDTAFWEMPGQQNASADIQAISRAFQQDARRYDGGFPLY